MITRRTARTSTPSTQEEMDLAFDKAFSLVAFIMNRHFIDHLLRCGRHIVDGDYEALVLLGVLAHQSVAHLMPPGAMPASVLNEAGRVAGQPARLRPMLLRDLAAITGIPRETARRKLEKLAGMGYVERVDTAWSISDTRLEPELRDFTRESTKRLLAAADDVRAAMQGLMPASGSRARPTAPN
jgi:hypothetical protein